MRIEIRIQKLYLAPPAEPANTSGVHGLCCCSVMGMYDINLNYEYNEFDSCVKSFYVV